MADKTEAEEMRAFFTARADIYEEHMLKHWAAAYGLAAALVPAMTKTLLDLGCGTGLELDYIFRRLPDISVTGIDITPEMLSRLKRKHGDKKLKLIEGDYFAVPFGEGVFDAAISFESLHHFSAQEKAGLYRRLYKALRPGGIYIECDYMARTAEEEAAFERESLEIRSSQRAKDAGYLHFDRPLSEATQISLIAGAGFKSVQTLWREENTVLLIAGRAK